MNSNSPRVYIAGPFSGDVDGNCARAIDAAEEVRRAGFLPFVPHLYRAFQERHGLAYETVMDLCFGELGRSDAVRRIPGASPGADREVARAEAIGIPVFLDLAALLQWRDSAIEHDPALVSARANLRDLERAFRALSDSTPDPERDARRWEVGNARTALRLLERRVRGEPVAVGGGSR